MIVDPFVGTLSIVLAANIHPENGVPTVIPLSTDIFAFVIESCLPLVTTEPKI